MKNLVTVLAGTIIVALLVSVGGCGNTKDVETTEEQVVVKSGYDAVAEKFFNDYVKELEEGLEETRQEMKEEGENLDEKITVSYRYECIEEGIYDYIVKCDMYDGNVVEIHIIVDIWDENYNDEMYYFTLNGDRVLEDVINEMYEDIFYF